MLKVACDDFEKDGMVWMFKCYPIGKTSASPVTCLFTNLLPFQQEVKKLCGPFGQETIFM